LNYEVQFTI